MGLDSKVIGHREKIWAAIRVGEQRGLREPIEMLTGHQHYSKELAEEILNSADGQIKRAYRVGEWIGYSCYLVFGAVVLVFS